MKLRRDKRKKSAGAEPPAAKLGLKPPGGGKLKWIKVGFAWDLFVLSPLFGLPLFLRKLPQWGAVMLALLLADIVVGLLLSGDAASLAGMAITAIYIVLDLYLGFRGNALTARAYLRHGWSVDHPDYAATRKLMTRWKLGD
ncbi:MAG TPA: hypothetical protein VMQ63_01835 [Stellaceae bacterium]|jgi:hypothetical protein|nr:hypothetical protein [Stellaceae bacterium]